MKRLSKNVLYVFITFFVQLAMGCSDDNDPSATGPVTPGPGTSVVPHSEWAFSDLVISGRPGYWDSEFTSGVEVVLFKDTLRMWYEGSSAIYSEPIHFGYAWSLNGTTWNRAEDPVFMANAGKWDYPHVAAPSVFVDGDTLRMWYGGGDYTQPGMTIGYAVSTDGVNWVRNSQNVIGSTKTWNPDGVLPGPVLKEDGIYKMWMMGGKGVIGFPSQETYWGIALATSADGISWDVTDQPVMYPGTTFDKNSLLAGTVIHTDTAYVMYYSGSTKVSTYSESAIGMAFSEDGITWEKYENNPIYERSGTSTALYYPQVMEFNDTFYMWLSAWRPGPFVHSAKATN